MKKLLLTASLFLLGCNNNSDRIAELNQQIIDLRSQIQEIEQSNQAEQQDIQKLKGFTLKAMEEVGSQLSLVQKKFLADDIVFVVREYFPDRPEVQRTFISLIGIESKFDKNARSSAGAVGLTQIIPRYAVEFGRPCNLELSGKEDLTYDRLNLSIGSCLFKSLLDKLDNDVYLALVAYNAGPSSEAIKQMLSLKNITNVETANYPSKVLRVKENAKKKNTQEELTQESPP